MKLGVVRMAGSCMLVVALAFSLVACGGPDTEDQTLAEARSTLADAGVPEENITVRGAEAQSGDPDVLVVCDQEPDAAPEDGRVVLRVATDCPLEFGGKRKRGFGGMKRR